MSYPAYLDEIFGEAMADQIRDIVTTSFVRSYEQNETCYDESIGHTPIVYGFMVRSTGIMHLAHAFGGMSEVRVTESGNVFEVAFPDGWAMHFYKYRDMHTAKFDRSRVRRTLISDNQLSLFDPSFGQRAPGEVINLRRHLVVVHQGEPFHGLRSIDVGVPVSMAVDGSQWLWRENIYKAPLVAPVVDSETEAMPSYAELPIPALDLDLANPAASVESEHDAP